MHNSISLDMDGVLYDFLTTVREYFPNIPKDPLSFELHDFMTNEERLSFFKFLKSPNVIGSLSLYPEALDFIKWARKKFKLVYVVTARDKGLSKATSEQIKGWGVKVDELIFEKEKQKVIPDKVTICMEDDPYQLDNLKRFKYLKILVPQNSYTKGWIEKNIGEFSIYPYKSFDEAKKYIESILEENNV
jgi:5'(3')-deoxyribonucleotidase